MMRGVYLLFCSLLLAQQDATFSSGVKVVNVLATVRNGHGQIVQNLTKDDFTLTEEGRPQAIRYFSRETDLPLTLGLLVDISGSQRRIIPAESRASYQFLRQVLREDKDQAFVIHFDREVELLQDLTPSRSKLEKALDSLASPVQSQSAPTGRGRGGGGSTSLYDAATLASDEVMKKQSGRKAVIVLSDGVDTSSKLSLSSAIESAQRADTMIYAVLFSDAQAGRGAPAIRMGGQGRGRRGGGGQGGPGGGGPRQGGQRADGKKVLQQMARETGGGFFEVSSKQPIEKVFARIEEELRSQYSLGFSPEKAGDASGFRAIRLTAKGKDMVVQTRSGYYGQ